MKRVALAFVGMLLVGPVLVAEPLAGASSQVRPSVVAGNYTFYLNYQNTGYEASGLLLRRNHTGNSPPQVTVQWSSVGRGITMVLTFRPKPENYATYTGVVSKAGLNSLKNPGTMSVSGTVEGTWYAVKTT